MSMLRATYRPKRATNLPPTIRTATLEMISGESKTPDFVAEVLQLSEVDDMEAHKIRTHL